MKVESKKTSTTKKQNETRKAQFPAVDVHPTSLFSLERSSKRGASETAIGAVVGICRGRVCQNSRKLQKILPFFFFLNLEDPSIMKVFMKCRWWIMFKVGSGKMFFWGGGNEGWMIQEAKNHSEGIGLWMSPWYRLRNPRRILHRPFSFGVPFPVPEYRWLALLVWENPRYAFQFTDLRHFFFGGADEVK